MLRHCTPADAEQTCDIRDFVRWIDVAYWELML
jgi:hypothetical protein